MQETLRGIKTDGGSVGLFKISHIGGHRYAVSFLRLSCLSGASGQAEAGARKLGSGLTVLTNRPPPAHRATSSSTSPTEPPSGSDASPPPTSVSSYVLRALRQTPCARQVH